MPKTEQIGRYALALLALVLFPCSLVGGTLQIHTFINSDRQLPQEWAHGYDREFDGEAQSFVECPNGDLLIGGTVWGNHYRLMRVHEDGSVVWVGPQPYSSPYLGYTVVHDMVNLSTDRYLVASGRSYEWNGSRTSRTWLLCVDGLGEEVWNRSYGFGGPDYPAVALASTDGGALILTSSYSTNATGTDLCAFRVDSDGTEFWNATYPTRLTEEQAEDATTASDGSIVSVVTGYNSSSGSRVSVVRCLEPTGAQRWNQTYDNALFYSVACGIQDDIVMIGRQYGDFEHCIVLCIDHDGRTRWTFSAPMDTYWSSLRSSGHAPAVATCQEGYLIVGRISDRSSGLSWEGLLALSVDNSGISRWNWMLETPYSSSSGLNVIASRNGGFCIMTCSFPFCLMRLPDPPTLTTSIALLAQNNYTIAILLALVLSSVALTRVLFARRLRADSSGVPHVLLLGGLALQIQLLFLWTQLVATSGPLHPYFNEDPASLPFWYVDATTALLFLLFSPAGIANGLLGILAFVGLQIAVFVLDSRRSNGSTRRLGAQGLGYPFWVFVTLLVFLILYTLAYPFLSHGALRGDWQGLAFWLAMAPFLNGVVLVGFLPNFLLSWRWPRGTGNSRRRA